MKSTDVLMPAKGMALIEDEIGARLTLHRLWLEPNPDHWLAEWAPRIRAIAMTGVHAPVDEAYMRRFPHLEIISSFGVGYDNIDARAAGRLGITVTNTPGVLDEEVADTALGLMIMTVRQLPQAERHLRAGLWAAKGGYPLSPSLRGRTVGILGLGRIGKAIARRVSAFGLDVVYHGRHPQPDVAHRYYPSLIDMAKAADVLIVVAPGGPATRHIINTQVLDALGPDGVLDQHRAGLAGRREGADRGFADGPDPRRGARRVRERAERAQGADCARQRGAAAPRRLGVGQDPPGDGPMRDRQCVRLGRRQAAADPRARDALAGEMGEGRIGARRGRRLDASLRLLIGGDPDGFTLAP